MEEYLARVSFIIFAILCPGMSGAAGQAAPPVTPQETPPRAAGAQSPDALVQVDVFVSGKDGYHTYRIPSIVRTPKGTLIAVCEGRKNGRGDSGDIDLVMKRSFDNGATWSPMQVIADDGENTTGNPTLVVDRNTTTIWLFTTRNPGDYKESDIIDGLTPKSRTVWVMKSTDDGATWSEAVDITSSVKKRNWSWYATGPGVGIQLKSGRLVIPCNHFELGTKVGRSHIIYSDDHGATWKIGGIAGAGTNESQVVERDDGSLLLNMRNHRQHPQIYVRAIAISVDGGLTWSKVAHDPMLIEPICQASIIRHETAGGRSRSVILFSNPASLKRERLTVRLSYDGGQTWPVARLINPKGSAYSNLISLSSDQIGCLYEYGDQQLYEKIVFARFSLAWLTDKGEGAPGSDMRPITRPN
jgi:sialidase-1